MTMLGRVVKGKIETPDLIVLYGPDGVGKSTFGASAPSPIFLGTEKGTANLDVARLPSPKTMEEVSQAIAELTSEAHDYRTLVVDSLDWLEPIVWDKVCKDAGSTNIEQAYGGYGKGYVAANKVWQQMLAQLSDLREKKRMNIILLAHSMVKTFQDPQQNAGYDRYQLKLNDKASALFREFADCVFFANYEVFTKTDQTKRTRAFGEGARLMHTERRPAYDAKNRLGLPPVLPLSWEDYIRAKTTGAPQKPEALLSTITELLGQVTDSELKGKVEKAVKDAGSDLTKLGAIQNRLRVLLSQ